MGAGLALDLGNSCQFHPSASQAVGASQASGVVVGLFIDLKNSDALCNVWVCAGAGSGPVGIALQTSDEISGLLQSGGGKPTSGSFVDPTSGMSEAGFPSPDRAFIGWGSGGVLWVNSGLVQLPGGGAASGQYVGGAAAFTFTRGTHPIYTGQGGGGYNTSGSWPLFASGGGFAVRSFARRHRFVRLVILSGESLLPGVTAGFISQLKTTGSGGGYDYRPTSGGVVV